MTFRLIVSELSALFKRWFHKRNIIIVSEHKVKHIPVGASVQFAALSALVGFVCWASYSTGSFVAARDALKEQGQALRSITSAHVETSFNPLHKAAATAQAAAIPSADPMVSRMAYLENKVSELRAVNTEIIQRVQEKTGGRIDDLEAIIKQTGLDAGNLKQSRSDKKAGQSQGGPYIPVNIGEMPDSAHELFSDLDELARLRSIVGNLPLATPLKGGQEQSSFGHRYDPFTNHLAFHSGLDISGPSGAKIVSTADGTVVAAERNGNYGNMVDIDHGNGVTTRYGHLSEISVMQGQHVAKGDVIGIQGSTGRSTGAHLHYEVRYKDKPMDPKNFLQAGRYVSQQ